MAAPAGDGHTVREHLEGLRQRTGIAPPELIAPPCPPAMADVWNAFLELDRTRGSNGWGPNPISYGEIDAWARLTGRAPSAHDVRLYAELDRLVLEHYAELAGKFAKKGGDR